MELKVSDGKGKTDRNMTTLQTFDKSGVHTSRNIDSRQ